MEPLIAKFGWAFIVLLLIVGALWLLFRPRQRVRLSDDAPTRPHMRSKPPAEGRGIAGEAAAAAGDISGDILQAPVHATLDADGDDFSRLKGVGPKFADALRARGFTRFDQLSGLSSTEIERLEVDMGAFRGRLARDRIVEQAAYLARNDIDGFEQTFGKL